MPRKCRKVPDKRNVRGDTVGSKRVITCFSYLKNPKPLFYPSYEIPEELVKNSATIKMKLACLAYLAIESTSCSIRIH